MSWKYFIAKQLDNEEFITATLVLSSDYGIPTRTEYTESFKYVKTPEKYMGWKKLFELADKISFAKKTLTEKEVLKLIVKGRKDRGFYPKKSSS